MSDIAEARRPSAIIAPIRGAKNLVIGTLAGLTPVTAILLLGWLMRDMHRVAMGRPAAGWVLGPPGSGYIGRMLGGLADNIRTGFRATFALALGTLPFAGIWIASWWAGWDNSFNKGYEQAVIGPLTGLAGVGIFMVVMIWLPTAQAHMAVERRLSAFFDFARIRSAARNAEWAQLWWAGAVTVLALPVFAARGLPAFAEGIIPGFADYTTREISDLKGLIALGMAAYLFLALVFLRRWQARIYARAVARAIAAGDGALWRGTEIRAAIRTDPQPRRAPRWIVGLIRMPLILALWWFFAAQIYVGQFLHHGWHVWLSHPLVALPWMP